MSEVLKAISAIQAVLAKDGIAKNGKNEKQNYRFRSIEDCYSALAPLLCQHNLLIFPNVIQRTATDFESKSGGSLFFSIVEVEYEFISTKDDSTKKVRFVGEAMDSGDKGTNKAMSAAYKLMATQTFCIHSGGDSDTENESHEVQSKKPQDKGKAVVGPAMPMCPGCGTNTSVILSRYGTKYACFKGKGGCGDKFDDTDEDHFQTDNDSQPEEFE